MNGRKVAYGLVAALVVWKVVLPVISFGFGLLGSGLYATTTAAGFTNPESESLRAAIRNVTTDYDQLTMLLQEYFELKGSLHDTSCELDLKDFLSRRAARSRPALENGLDWVLALYKVLWPVLVIMLLSRINSGKSDRTTIDVPSDRGSLNSVANKKGAAALASRRTVPARSKPPSSEIGRTDSHPHRQ